MQQFESKCGYVFEVEVSTAKSRMVSIAKRRFGVKLRLDKELVKKIDPSRILYGEHVRIFESLALLQAYADGLTFANVPDHVRVHGKPTILYLLMRVRGPLNKNPSVTLQLAKIYESLRVKIKRNGVWQQYAEFPITHPSIIAGNKNTRIVEE